MASLDSLSKQAQKEVLAGIIKDKDVAERASDEIHSLESKVEYAEKLKPTPPQKFAIDTAGAAEGYIFMAIVIIAGIVVAMFLLFAILTPITGHLLGSPSLASRLWNIAEWFLNIGISAIKWLFSLKHILIIILISFAWFCIAPPLIKIIYSPIYNRMLDNYNRKNQRRFCDLNSKIDSATREMNTANQNFIAACDKYNIPPKYRYKSTLKKILSYMNTWALSFYEACRKYDEDEYHQRCLDEMHDQHVAAVEWAKMQAETRQLAEDEYRKKVLSELNDLKQQEYENQQRRQQEMEYDRWRRSLD